MVKILVTGSRKLNQADIVWNYFMNRDDITEIIHGGAMGADSLVEAYALQNNIKTTIIRSNCYCP